MRQTKIKQIVFKVFFSLSLLSLALLGFTPSLAQAATASLYFAPSTASIGVGNAVSVRVYVSSTQEAMNAVEATIAYPADLLDVTGVDKVNSIISLWVQEPTFGNGAVNLSAIVLNPGYQGSAGKIITINFRAKAVGVARLSFSSASVLANDGQGTNILSGAGSATINIAGTAEQPANNPSPSTDNRLPPAPIVISATHPDQTKWYANNNPTFNWTIPSGVNGVNVYGDQVATTDPGTVSDGLKSTWTYKDVKDGVWYFHIKYRNSAGWGPTTHYTFQIDTVKPDSFDITPATGREGEFTFKATDATSGIDHYELAFDGGNAQTWSDDGGHVYKAPNNMSIGHHTMVAKAVDKAGNFLDKSIDFNITQAAAPAAKASALRLAIPWQKVGLIALIVLGALIALLVLWLILKGLRKLLWLFLGTGRQEQKKNDVEELRRAFNLLNQNVREVIDDLERLKTHRDLTREETSVLRDLSRAIYGRGNEKAVAIASHSSSGERIVEGIFNGQGMTGFDGKDYSVPANYASKSHLVEGDQLKLTIADDGTFVYKQIGPIDRKRVFGELIRQGDEYAVEANDRSYKVLLAAVTYFKAEPGDEVTVIVPKDKETEWAAIEHVVKAEKPKIEEPKTKTARKPRKKKVQ